MFFVSCFVYYVFVCIVFCCCSVPFHTILKTQHTNKHNAKHAQHKKNTQYKQTHNTNKHTTQKKHYKKHNTTPANVLYRVFFMYWFMLLCLFLNWCLCCLFVLCVCVLCVLYCVCVVLCFFVMCFFVLCFLFVLCVSHSIENTIQKRNTNNTIQTNTIQTNTQYKHKHKTKTQSKQTQYKQTHNTNTNTKPTHNTKPAYDTIVFVLYRVVLV